jgi:ATP-dependent Clp protease ATP-binding subunit ClpA
MVNVLGLAEPMTIERFTDEARQALAIAQEEARDLGATSVSPEHLLLGVLADTSSLTAKVLDGYAVTRATLRDAIRLTGSAEAKSERPPFSRAAKRAIEFAATEAVQLGHRIVRPDHLAIGIVRTGSGLAAESLIRQGLGLQQLRLLMQQIDEDPTRGLDAILAEHQPPKRIDVPKPTSGMAYLAVNAIRRAQELSSGRVGTHHYVLAVFDDPNSAAFRCFEHLGLTQESLLSAIAAVQIEETSDAAPEPSASTFVRDEALSGDIGGGIAEDLMTSPMRLLGDNTQMLSMKLQLVRETLLDLARQLGDSPEVT